MKQSLNRLRTKVLTKDDIEIKHGIWGFAVCLSCDMPLPARNRYMHATCWERSGGNVRMEAEYSLSKLLTGEVDYIYWEIK